MSPDQWAFVGAGLLCAFVGYLWGHSDGRSRGFIESHQRVMEILKYRIDEGEKRLEALSKYNDELKDLR